MGCVCLKGFSANKFVLKKANKSANRLLHTPTSDDVVVTLDNGADAGLFSESNEENMRHNGDMEQLALTPSTIDTESRVGIYQHGMYRVDGVQQKAGRWAILLTGVVGEATNWWLPDSFDNMHKLYMGGVFRLVFLERVLLIKMYASDTVMPEQRKTHFCSRCLRDDDTVQPHQTLFTLSIAMDESEYDKMDGFFLDFLSEDISGERSQKRRDTLYTMQTMASASSKIGSVAGSMSKDIHLLPLGLAALCNFFLALVKTLWQFIKTKLIDDYLPELASFLASASEFSSYGFENTTELLLDLPICKVDNGMQKMLYIQHPCSNIFLKRYNDQCISRCLRSVLLRAIGASKLQENQVLVMFEEMAQLEQEDMLIYLYMNWQDLRQVSWVIEALKETNFVTGADGSLYKPRDLYDPGDALLALVFSGEVHKFPGGRFLSDGWLSILRETGLQNTDDTDIMLECARRIEFLGAESMKYVGPVDDKKQDSSNKETELSLEVWSLAETLIKTIFEKFSFLYGQNFCNLFHKIACIPAEKGFPFPSGKNGAKRVLCSYSEAILLKDWPLAWTTAPILSRESIVPPEYSWGALQLRSPPPFTLVLKHLEVVKYICSLSGSFGAKYQ